MSTASVLPWAGLLSGVVALLIAILNSVTTKDIRNAEAAAKTAVGAKESAEATSIQHKLWFDQSETSYARVREECDDCKAELRRFASGIYGIFEDLEDQIIPMMMVPGADMQLTRDAVRASIRKARNTIAAHPPNPIVL